MVNEPRGSDTIVGALLCAPHRADCSLGVIFFNNVGYLGMCGHGTIGLVASLAHLGGSGRAGCGSTRRWARSTRELHARRPSRRRQRAELPQGARASRSRCRASGRCAATSPGAATGSSWSRRRASGIALAERRGADRFHLARAPGAERAGLSRGGSRRVVRRRAERRRRQPQFRAVPRQGVRPLALRHRHQRQARLPGRRRQARRRRRLDAGERHRQQLSRRSFRWLDRAPARSRRLITRPRACHRREHAAARCRTIHSAGESDERTIDADDERADHHAHPRQDPVRRLLARLRRCSRTPSPPSSA